VLKLLTICGIMRPRARLPSEYLQYVYNETTSVYCSKHYVSQKHVSDKEERRVYVKKGKASPYSIPERSVPELIPVLGSQPAGDASHKPGGRLPLLSARPVVTFTTLKSAATSLAACWTGTVGVNSLPKTVTRQRRDCDLNPGPSAPESNTLTTRLHESA